MSDYEKPFETKDFTGALFINDRREKETDPNAKGSATIAGVEYWVSAWTNTSAKGVRYQSLKYTAKEAVHNTGLAQAKQAAAPAVDTFGESDIPFAPYDKGQFV